MSPVLIERPLDPAKGGVGFVVPADMWLDGELQAFLGWDVHGLIARKKPTFGAMNRDFVAHIRDPEVVKEAAQRLEGQGCDVVVDACFSATAVDLDTRQVIRQALADGAVKPVAATLTAADALVGVARALGVSRIGMALPYSEEVSEDSADFMRDQGFTVMETAFAGRESEIPRISRAHTTELIEAAAVPGVEAVFVVCTNLRTYGLLADAAKKIGKPVWSVNQAIAWAALELLRKLEEAAM